MPGIEPIDAGTPRYLQNTEEVLNPEESYLSGEVPVWLKGSLFSSSPGVFDLENASVNNWFDGYAILNKFVVNGNKVSFKSKYLKSKAFEKALEAKRPIMPEFGTPPWTNNRTFFSKLLPFGPYDCTDNVVGTIFKIGASLYTAGDTCYFHEIDANNLQTIGSYHTVKAFGMNSVSSQPLEDKEGNVYLIGCAIQPTFRYSVLKMPAGSKDKPLEKRFSPITSFSSRWMFGACPCRNFGMTENYIIMIEMPLVLNIMKLSATYVKGYCATNWLDWRPEDGVKFYIIHKETGDLLKTEIFSSQPFFTPNVINAFEDENEIFVDVLSMPNLDCNQATLLKNLRTRPDSPISPDERPLDSGTVHRYIIPVVNNVTQYPEGHSFLKRHNPSSSSQENIIKSPYLHYTSVSAKRNKDRVIIIPEILSASGLGADFQVINPNYKGKRYTFVYNTSGYISTPFSPYAHGIAKLNVETKEVIMWEGKRGQVPSEPVFIPNPQNSSSEDDGILLTLVKMEKSYEHNDFLVAVCAKNMKEIGRAEFKSKIAGWYHANFFQELR